jgi:hypothetical protein
MVFLYQNQRHTIYPGTMYKIVISFLFFSFVTSCKHHAVNILGNALGMGNPSRFKKTILLQNRSKLPTKASLANSIIECALLLIWSTGLTSRLKGKSSDSKRKLQVTEQRIQSSDFLLVKIKNKEKRHDRTEQYLVVYHK